MSNYHMSYAQKSNIFIDGVLNIFTDASVDKVAPSMWNACSGAVCVDYKDGISVMSPPQLAILKNCTNNIAELTGVELACDIAIENQTKYHRINVFSDSEYSVKALKEWIFAWVRITCSFNGDGDGFTQMRKGDGQIVKNQTIIKNIVNKICSIRPEVCQFNIYHVKAHSKDNVEKIQSQFFKANGIHINLFDAEIIGYYNDFIDNATRDLLHQDPENDQARFKVVPFAIHPMNFDLYRSIIGGRDFDGKTNIMGVESSGD